MRYFVIGNGPSLANTPLERLIGERTIAMNRIHLIYPKTDWRPEIYVRTDHNPRATGWADELNLQVSIAKKCYLWDVYKDGYPKEHPNHEDVPCGIGDRQNIVWVERCEHHYFHYDSPKRATAWHLPKICTAYNGIGVAIQVAVLEGASEIVLLGCDLGYGRPPGQDHFDSSYHQRDRILGEWDNQNALAAHEVAKSSSPVPIYNATPGGYLDIYPRIRL